MVVNILKILAICILLLGIWVIYLIIPNCSITNVGVWVALSCCLTVTNLYMSILVIKMSKTTDF